MPSPRGSSGNVPTNLRYAGATGRGTPSSGTDGGVSACATRGMCLRQPVAAPILRAGMSDTSAPCRVWFVLCTGRSAARNATHEAIHRRVIVRPPGQPAGVASRGLRLVACLLGSPNSTLAPLASPDKVTGSGECGTDSWNRAAPGWEVDTGMVGPDRGGRTGMKW